MPASDFTLTLLTHLQEDRTTPSGGWLDDDQLSSLMGLSASEKHHLSKPLNELRAAGLIERRFDGRRGRDMWRSIGTMPDITRSVRHPDEEAAPAAVVNEPLGDTARAVFIYLCQHPGFVVDADLMHALQVPTLGLLWAALSQLEAAGLTQRRLNNGRAVRLHTAVWDVVA